MSNWDHVSPVRKPVAGCLNVSEPINHISGCGQFFRHDGLNVSVAETLGVPVVELDAHGHFFIGSMVFGRLDTQLHTPTMAVAMVAASSGLSAGM